MARNHATIYTSIWNDPEFVEQRESAQRLYFLLLSQPDLNLCGVTAHRPRLWAQLASDTTSARIVRSLQELDTAGFVIIDRDTDELAVRSFLIHNNVLKAPNTFKGMCQAYGTIHSSTIRAAILRMIPAHLQGGFPDAYLRAHPKKLAALLAEEAFPEPFEEGLQEPLTEPLRQESREPRVSREENREQGTGSRDSGTGSREPGSKSSSRTTYNPNGSSVPAAANQDRKR